MNPVLLALLKNVGTKILLEVADIAIDMLKGESDNDVNEDDSARIKNALKRYNEREQNGKTER